MLLAQMHELYRIGADGFATIGGAESADTADLMPSSGYILLVFLGIGFSISKLTFSHIYHEISASSYRRAF